MKVTFQSLSLNCYVKVIGKQKLRGLFYISDLHETPSNGLNCYSIQCKYFHDNL